MPLFKLEITITILEENVPAFLLEAEMAEMAVQELMAQPVQLQLLVLQAAMAMPVALAVLLQHLLLILPMVPTSLLLMVVSLGILSVIKLV
ncbi:hypothetical protein SDC9_91707 [bioreactor metagenome]|uniref:Uncharacterized protein n=1 Tax=bioreactor metagenome TaxID=1076179 RepID=A0A644ZW05_9ZZZZ